MAVFALSGCKGESSTVDNAYLSKLCSAAPFDMEAVTLPSIPDGTVNLKDFGAIGDGITLCTDAFAEAVKQEIVSLCDILGLIVENTGNDVDKALEEETGIHVDWTLVRSGYDEKKAVTLASGNLPDAFFGDGLTDADISGNLDLFVPLEDYIAEYCPNISNITY